MATEEKKQGSSALEVNATNEDEAKFGSRTLNNTESVFEHNAW